MTVAATSPESISTDSDYGFRLLGLLGPEMTNYDPRRSALQEPEQEPPLHEPMPTLPASRPEPVALRPPALTVTVIAPLPATLPVIVMAVSPALASVPFKMRTG